MSKEHNYYSEVLNKKTGVFEPRKEYILCAAIRRLKPREVVAEPYYKNDILLCEIGYRHLDIFRRFYDEISKKPSDQGFYTSYGRFVDRTEAMKIAYEAGQVTCYDAFTSENPLKYSEDNYKDVFNDLFSEDLY